MTEHTIIVRLEGYEGNRYEMVCSDPDACTAVYTETTWAAEGECRCKDKSCVCRVGDHAGCSEFSGYITDIDYLCRCVPVKGCGLKEWLSELGEESLDVWEGVSLEVPVEVDWSHGDGPLFRPVERTSDV